MMLWCEADVLPLMLLQVDMGLLLLAELAPDRLMLTLRASRSWYLSPSCCTNWKNISPDKRKYVISIEDLVDEKK